MSDPLRIKLDLSKSLVETRDVGHNRWHPAVPILARVQSGQQITVDTRDGADGQVRRDSDLGNLVDIDIDFLHPLTGPFYLEEAEEGDLVELEIMEILPGDFGWSGVFPGGGGLMREFVEEPLVIGWELSGNVARSEALPGIAIPGKPFVGVYGTAPSEELLEHFNQREQKLKEAGGWALLPDANRAVPDQEPVASRGARTMPPRETGGNFDVKYATESSRVLLPVHVDGALFSIGDMHFAQGDGESYGTAIEMQATVTFRLHLQKRDAVKWVPSTPFIEQEIDPVPERRHALISTGLSIDELGINRYMDVTLAVRNALEEMARYLVEVRGLTKNQAYIVISVAADVRVSVINNPPTPVATVVLPREIFVGE